MRVGGAASGIVLVGLLAVAYLLGGPMPPAGTAPDQLVAFLKAHSDTQEWSWFLASGPALLAGPWFLGVLTAHLWDADPARRYLVAAGLTSALVAAALLALATVAWGLFVYLGTQITSPSLILVLAESRHFAEGSICFPVAGAVAAYTPASRRVLPAWGLIAALGVAAVALQLANGVDDFAVDGVTGALGPAALAAFLGWLLAVSAALTAACSRRRSPPATGGVAPAAATRPRSA